MFFQYWFYIAMSMCTVIEIILIYSCSAWRYRRLTRKPLGVISPDRVGWYGALNTSRVFLRAEIRVIYPATKAYRYGPSNIVHEGRFFLILCRGRDLENNIYLVLEIFKDSLLARNLSTNISSSLFISLCISLICFPDMRHQQTISF